MNNHILSIEKQQEELFEIFEKIQKGNTILFLGAGASIGEKKFLSKEIIELYEEYLGKEFNINDITKFVDVLSTDPDFDRAHFDREIENMLKKLNPTKEHEIMVSLPWREIITSNFDLLVEKAYDNIMHSSNSLYEIKPIREVKEYNYKQSNNEIKYIKLNGCISDKSKYPLAFSTDDFTKRKNFYKVVLNDLRNLSFDISFISIGYSFSDDFGQKVLKEFDSYNSKDRRWLINITPFPNENMLNYYTSQRIRIVKMSFSDFFNQYKEWETSLAESKTKKNGFLLRNSQKRIIRIPAVLQLKLKGTVQQLNVDYNSRFINPVEFYKGEEPNYKTIINSIDVIRIKRVNELKKENFENNKMKISIT